MIPQLVACENISVHKVIKKGIFEDDYDGTLESIDLSQNGKLLAAGSSDHIVRLWNLSDEKKVVGDCHRLFKHKEAVESVCFSPTGELLASGGKDKKIVLWDTAKKIKLSTLRGHKEAVYKVTFAPRHDLLASTSADNTVVLWQPHTKAENPQKGTITLNGCKESAFNPSAQTLAIPTLSSYVLIDVPTAKVTYRSSEFVDKEGGFDLLYRPIFIDEHHLLFDVSQSRVSKWNHAVRVANISAAAAMIFGVKMLLPNMDTTTMASGTKDIFEYPTGIKYHEHEFYLFDTRLNYRIKTFGKSNNHHFNILFDSTRNMLVCSHEEGWFGDRVTLWDTKTFTPIKQFDSTSLCTMAYNGLFAQRRLNVIKLFDLSPLLSMVVPPIAKVTEEMVKAELHEIKKQRLIDDARSKVFQATWKGETVALKRIKYQSEEERDILLHEAKTLSQVSHPAIVQFKAFLHDEAKGRIGIITELVEQTLFDLNKNKVPLDWPTQLSMAKELTSAITFLHHREPIVLHGDLKSVNVLVTRDLKIKLADFGSCKIASSYASADIRNVARTIRWSAPEVLKTEMYTVAAEIWSLGMTLFEIGAREVPYAYLSDDKLRAKIENEELPLIPKLMNPSLAILVKTCWQEPHLRPSAKQIMEGLTKIV